MYINTKFLNMQDGLTLNNIKDFKKSIGFIFPRMYINTKSLNTQDGLTVNSNGSSISNKTTTTTTHVI
jgi:hypothetical protein